MTAIINGEYVYAWHKEGKKDSQGGTELMTQKLAEVIDKELLEKFWIVSSRMPGPTYSMPEDKIRIFWAHDLAGDPANTFLSDKKAVEKFHKFVFVSNWQMQGYINRYNLPWDKCTVLLNAIDKIEVGDKPDTKDEMNLRIKSGVDHFYDVQSLSHQEVVILARSLEIDIAVDLGGFTKKARTEIFAMQAAPIQINYLGYPASMGLSFIDYII